MANNNESTMKWKVDITQLKAAMQEAKRAISQANAEFKTATAGMDKWSKSTTGLEAKLSQLNTVLPAQKRQLEVLKAQYEETVKTMGENSQAAADLKLKIENQKATITKTETSIAKYNSQLSDMRARQAESETAVGKLSQTISDQEDALASLKKEYANATLAYGENSDEAKQLASQISSLSSELADNKTKMQEANRAADQFDQTIEDTTEDTKELGDGFTVLKGTMANLAADAVRGLLNGFKKLGSAMVDVGKQAYSAYASYEQLTGGVETLFGDSADVVKGYAANAYKTAGMSANAYMETVTSFSASLLQGLNGDTAKAAQVADQAITDMSDNANKMGTSMEMIQNAYQGFAKDNYTMLDNLKLGYGGTKEEMLRLVKDAGVVNDSVESINDVSFDKIIEAIHVIQTNMGITGTTAKEAESTIEGSTLSMKAAWENLMVAVADENANMFQSLKQFTDSAEVMLQNAVPRIKIIITGLFNSAKSLVRKYAPEVADTLFPILEDIGNAIKDIGKFVINNFKTIVPVVLTAVAAFTALKAAMAIQAMIKAVTVALDGLAAGASLATKAQVGLNAAMSANPIGAVITAVAALIALFVALANTQTEAQKAHEEEMNALQEQADMINENVDAWDRLTESQQQNVDAGMTEISHYESLYDELQNIVDANGKVKKGYESRASFITSQLAEALGIEINMVDGVIQGYSDLQDEIDKTMEKKKAQIILDAQESMYKEAITGQSDALRELNKIQDDVNVKKQESADMDAAITEARAGLLTARTIEESNFYNMQLKYAEDNKRMKEEEIAQAESNYNTQKELLAEYAYNIGLYEENMQLAHEGKYNEMSTVNWDYVKDYQSSSEAQKQMLEDQITNEETNLALLKELKAKSGTDLYDQQIKQSESRLAQHKESLKQYTSATKGGMNDVKIEWKKGLDEQLSELTDAKIEFKEGADGLVQMYINGIAEGKPKTTKEMAQLVTDTITEISKQKTGAKTAGEDLIDGVNNGVANQNKQSGVFATIANFGANLLARLKASLQEKSPSKATAKMGEDLVEGLNVGIKARQKASLNNISSFGKNLTLVMSDSINNGSKQIEKALNNMMAKLIKGNINNVSKTASSAIKKADAAIETALKASKNVVKKQIDNYFTTLTLVNKQEIENAEKAYKATTDKAQKQRLKDKIDSLKKEKTQISKLYKDFGGDVLKAYNTAMEEAAKGVSDKLTTKIKNIAETAQKQIDEVNRSISSMTNTLVGYGDLFKKTSYGAMSLTDISKQTEAIKKYGANLNKLKGMVSGDLMDEIVSMGVDDANKYMALLLNMSDKELKEYDKLYSQKVSAAKKVSKAFYKDEVDAIKANYTDKVQAAFNDAKKEITKMGKQTIQGFFKGMKSADVDAEIKKISNTIIKTMKKALKINSPSKVFEQLGEFSGEGYLIGLSDSLSSLKTGVASDISAMMVNPFNGSGSMPQQQTVTFNQTINSPKAVDRLTVYRETNSLLFSAKVRLNNV